MKQIIHLREDLYITYDNHLLKNEIYNIRVELHLKLDFCNKDIVLVCLDEQADDSLSSQDLSFISLIRSLLFFLIFDIISKKPSLSSLEPSVSRFYKKIYA